MQVVLYCFDCLYLDGEVLLRKPLRDRREAMYKSIIPEEGKLQFATAKISRDIDELQVCLGYCTTGCKLCPWCTEPRVAKIVPGAQTRQAGEWKTGFCMCDNYLCRSSWRSPSKHVLKG